jgi:hypothetical protein
MRPGVIDVNAAKISGPHFYFNKKFRSIFSIKTICNHEMAFRATDSSPFQRAEGLQTEPRFVIDIEIPTFQIGFNMFHNI